MWNTLGLKRTADWAAIGGRAGVAQPGYIPTPRIWSDAQLGIKTGSVGQEAKAAFAPGLLNAARQQNSAGVSA